MIRLRKNHYAAVKFVRLCAGIIQGYQRSFLLNIVDIFSVDGSYFFF